MDTLFSEVDGETRFAAAPLAVRMRPRTLSEVVGQEEAIGKDTWLRRAIANDTLSSVILFGPAGTGKTSIAHVIANSTNAAFVEVSAVSGTVADLRREIKAAEERLQSEREHADSLAQAEFERAAAGTAEEQPADEPAAAGNDEGFFD